MNGAAEKKPKSRRWKWLGILILVGLGGCWMWRLGQKPAADVKALVVVRPRNPAAKAQNLDLGTQRVLLKSRPIIEHAIHKYDLGRIVSLKDAGDLVGAIQASLSTEAITRENKTEVIRLRWHGGGRNDGETILKAVGNSFQEFVDDDALFRGGYGASLDILNKERDQLKLQLQKMEDQYTKFRQEAPFIWRQAGGDPDLDRLARLATRKANATLRKEEAMAKRKSLNSPSAAAKVQAHEWATQIGLDRLPKMDAMDAVSAYRTYLQGLIDEAAVIEAEMSREIEVAAIESDKNLSLQIKEGQLRKELTRTELAYDRVTRRLQKVQLIHDSSGFDVNVFIEPPDAERR